MPNPVVTITNSIPTPPDPVVTRKTFTRIVYESQRFYVYSQGEDYSTFDPIGKGERMFMTVSVEESWFYSTSSYARPPFITDDAWRSIRYSPSVFVNAVKSVMPKLVVPSAILPDNGLKTKSPAYSGNNAAYYWDGGDKKGLFNWKVTEFRGGAVIESSGWRWGRMASYSGKNYLTVDPKDDKEHENTIRLVLDEPANKPSGATYGWKDTEPLVVSGAFVLLLNVVPERSGASVPTKAAEAGWEFDIRFGEVHMRMVEAGEMRVSIGTTLTGEDNWVSVNLMEGRTKGGPPQQESISEKFPYVMVVYPCWNGIVVSSGVQEARSSQFEIVTTQAASVYVPKLKEAAVMESPWSDGFDPSAPDEVFAWSSDTESGSPLTPAENTVVDFGTQMVVNARNCKFDIAYVPVFFLPWGAFDEWFLASDDIPGELDITYDVFPIWTTNATDMTLGTPAIVETGIAPPTPAGTHYNYILWDLMMPDSFFRRRHGELFGSIIEIIEEQEAPILNGNGNFDIVWSGGGSAGDKSAAASPDWKDYVQSINVSITKDGSNGQMVVDKYGPAGQGAVATQSIGALVFDMTSIPDGCTGGVIFKGLGIGIAESKSSQGATWTVPLVGLERKLDDIALINAPLMDGELLGTALTFLCQYAGLIADTSEADISLKLSVSEDVNVSRFNWKSGTTVREALDNVMDDSNHTYVVRDGQIFFYECDATNIPLYCSSATDWKPSYPDTKMVQDDQQPEFDNLRNKIVVMGMEAIYQGEGSKIEDPPAVIRAQIRNNTTNPAFPWMKALVEPMSGFTDEPQLSRFADNIQAKSSHYLTVGRTTIPGNANIKPYDRWGSLIIVGVTHTVDLVAKTWTTDLEMAGF